MAYGYRYSENSNWGELFGISVSDLDEKQLEKMKLSKLIEFANSDPRVEKIIGNRILKANIEDIKKISSLKDDELNKLPYLATQYNKCIRERCNILEKEEKKKYNYSRSSYILWGLLDKSNRAKEFARWIDGNKSIISECSIDYKWLYDNYNWMADQIVEKVLTNSSISPAVHMVSTLPEEPMKRFVGRIFERSKDVFVHALSNEYTPRDYIVKALREIAGRKKVPNMKVALNKSILGELPPVMRLKLLESFFLYMRKGNVTFSDIKTEEDLKPLLFGTAIKYNDRVNVVVKRFNILCTGVK